MRPSRNSEVVVVGAGVIGLAVALRLRSAGIGDVLVIDRLASPGLGSTGRANGGVRAQFTTPTNIAFSRYTIEALADLDLRSDGRIGLRRIGYLFMTGTIGGVQRLQPAYELQRLLGVEVEWLTADRVHDIAPYVDRGGLLAGTYCGTDGVIDPHGVVSTLWEEGRRLGVTYLFDTQITGMAHQRGRALVRSSHGDIEAEWVVNAAGPFARGLAATAGVDVPVLPYRRNLACTESVNTAIDQIPMCVDVDTGVLIRREAGGFLIGYSDPHDSPTTDSSFDPLFLDAVAARIGNRFSFLEHVPINPRKCWAGLYPETADHHAIIDAPAEAPWFIQCAGFGGHGIMHSLAAGLAVTELIRDGVCTAFDLRPLALDRFEMQSSAVETAVL